MNITNNCRIKKQKQLKRQQINIITNNKTDNNSIDQINKINNKQYNITPA